MDPRCLKTIKVEDTRLTGLAFCEDDNFVTAGIVMKGSDVTEKGIIRLHQQNRVIPYQINAPITCVAMAPKDKFIYGGDSKGKIWRVQISILKAIEPVRGQTKQINSIRFSADGTRYTTSSNNNNAMIWEYNLETEKKPKPIGNTQTTVVPTLIATLKGHNSWVVGSSFSPDSNVIVTCSDDKTARTWDVLTKSSRTFGPFPDRVTCAEFHPSGTIIGVSLANGTFLLIDVRNEKTIQCYKNAHNGEITALKFHPSGSFAITTGKDRKICIWDLIEGQLFYTIESHKAKIVDAVWNKDGSKFLTGDESGVVNVFQTNFDKLIQTIEMENSSAKDYADKRIEEATSVQPARKAAKSPKRKPGELTEDDKDLIEATLNKMLNQLEICTKSTSIFVKRMNMQAEKLQRLEDAQKE